MEVKAIYTSSVTTDARRRQEYFQRAIHSVLFKKHSQDEVWGSKIYILKSKKSCH